MGYLLSCALLPAAFLGLGLCVGQMESFVHTVYFNSKGENAKPLHSFWLMMATTAPWYLSFIVLHFIETSVLKFTSRKRLCQLLLSGLAGALFVALEMRRKPVKWVAFSYTALHLLASLIFNLLLSLTNDILNREGGLSKGVIVWGSCISVFYAAMGFGKTLVTGFVFYKVPLAYLQYTFVFLVMALLAVTVKRDPAIANEKQRQLAASKKDIDSKQESKTKKKRKTKTKKSKGSDSDSEITPLKNGRPRKPFVNQHTDIFSKIQHIFRVSKSLLLYMIVRRVPGMLVAWKVAPDYLTKMGFNPAVATFGIPGFTLLACSGGSLISALFIRKHNLLSTVRISSIIASLLLIPFLGLLLKLRMIRKFFRMVGLFVIAGEGLFTGFETAFLMMYFLDLNSQLPQNMRLCHLGLFAAMDRLSSHLLFTLLSAVTDNVKPLHTAVIIAVSIVVNCIVCLRVR